MRRRRLIFVAAVGVVGAGLAALVVTSLVPLLRSPAPDSGSALAAREATFRSQIAPYQALYLAVEHYRRQPPLPGSVTVDVEVAPERWVEESYTTFDAAGYIDREVTFEWRPDGVRVPTRAVVGQHAKLYDANGKLVREQDYPKPLPFDVGYAALRSYVERLFPSTAIEAEGGGTTALVSEIKDPSSYPTLADQTELEGLDVKSVRIRWEIDEMNGLLKLYRETAVLADGEEVTVSEDKVTTAKVVPLPDVLKGDGVQAAAAGQFNSGRSKSRPGMRWVTQTPFPTRGLLEASRSPSQSTPSISVTSPTGG